MTTKKNIAFILLSSLLAVVFSSRFDLAQAQILSRGNFFGPGALPARAGVELGLGLHRQEGTFDAACLCTFGDGKGTGFLAGLVFELPIDYDWAFSLKAGINSVSNTSDVMISDASTIRNVGDNTVDTGTIVYNRHAEVTGMYFMVTPGIRYQFMRGGPFLQLGAGIGILLSSHFTHKRELTSSDAVLLDGTVVHNVTFENGTLEETLEDGEIKGVKKLRFSAVFGGGYDIPISDKAIVTPMVMYDFPFTTLRDDALSHDWKISTLQLMVGLKYILE